MLDVNDIMSRMGNEPERTATLRLYKKYGIDDVEILKQLAESVEIAKEAISQASIQHGINLEIEGVMLAMLEGGFVLGLEYADIHNATKGVEDL